MTGPSPRCTGCSDTRTGQDSVTVRVLADWRSPMLLIDSRSSRVTTTCPIPGQASLIANLRDQIAEFPNVGCSRQALAFSARAPVSDLGTVVVLAFSRAPGTAELPCSAIRPLPAITASTEFGGSTGRMPGSTFPKASALSGRRRWNINQLPSLSHSSYGGT